MRRHLGRATALGVAARRRKAGNLPLLRTLQDLGVATSLELCLDAADYASYTGSGQSWLDTSGNGYDFFRGLDGTSEASDPTFNGTAGALTTDEYWSFDGGDVFRYDTSNETWMENIHKDNAVVTLATWLYPVSANDDGIAGTFAGGTGNIGFGWEYTGGLAQRIRIGSGSTVLDTGSASGRVVDSAWNFLAFSLDEATGTNGLTWFSNGNVDLDDCAYSSPSASNASFTLEIGGRGNGSAKLAANSRMAQFMAWSRALTAAELSDIYTKTRTRFGV